MSKGRADLRTVAYLSIGLNLFMLGYFTAHLPFIDRIDGPPPFMNNNDRPPPMLLFKDALPPEVLHAHFEHLQALRQGFIKKLASGEPVTKRHIEQYFLSLDQEMHGFRDQAEEMATKRILAMSKDERIAFAKSLSEEKFEHGPHHDHDAPR